MVMQDSRVTEKAIKVMDSFLSCAATHDNEKVQIFLSRVPSLIYARDENGNTVLHRLIGSNPENLATLHIILGVLTEVGFEPDLTLTNNLGADVLRVLEAYRGTPLYNAFGEALQPYMANYYAASGAALRAQNEAYFAREEVVEGKKAIKKIEDGGDGKCTIMSVQIDNDKAYSNIFGNKLFTMDDQKDINRFAQSNEWNRFAKSNVDPLPINFDFTPKGFALSSASSDMFSIMVIPSVFEGVTMEQIQHYVEKISDYLFGSAID